MRHTGSNTINISLPTSWAQLDDKMRLWILRVMFYNEYSEVEIKTRALVKFTGMRILEKSKAGWSFSVPVSFLRRKSGWLKTWEINFHIKLLDFLTDTPKQVVNVAKIRKFKAVNAELHDVSFETYIKCENLYQGYIATHKFSYLHKMAALLYKDKKGKGAKLRHSELAVIFYWWYSLKCVYALRFPYFFRRVDSSGATEKHPDMVAIMNAQIRTLTGGDITKEALVFQFDAYRALTELNEKAREAKELNDKMKK